MNEQRSRIGGLDGDNESSDATSEDNVALIDALESAFVIE